MTENNEKELMRMMTNAIKGINELRESNGRIENRLENVESEIINVKNDLAIVQTDVKVINKKMSNYSDEVSELRARVEILEEKFLSVN